LRDELEEKKILLDSGAMMYNVNCQRSEPFHIKYAMSPVVYLEKYLPKVKVPLEVLGIPEEAGEDIYKERFKGDYYADRLSIIEKHKNENTAVSHWAIRRIGTCSTRRLTQHWSIGFVKNVSY